MGKACTKDVSVARENRESSSPARESFSRQPSGQPDRSFYAPEIRPPHSVLTESLHDLSKTHRFYIHIYGLKARNLKLKNSSCDASTFCVINWDDFSFERRTKRERGGSDPKWGDTMQFYWAVPNLQKLKDRCVTLKVYEEVPNKMRVVGVTKVDLMTVASGPIHHDLRLYEPNKQRIKQNETGRLIFDLRMAQVCQLVIGPVEILVHIHESLHAIDELEVEGIGTKRPAALQSDSAATSPLRNTPSSSFSPIPVDDSIASNSRPTNSHPLPAIVESLTPFSKSIDLPSQSVSAPPSERNSFAAPPQITSSHSFQSRRRADEEDNADAVLSTGESIAVADEDKESVVETKLERAATGGHSGSDELEPFVAQWQLTIVPTGVDNPVEYCSSWTPLCDQPYWNAVDHTVVNELTSHDDSTREEEAGRKELRLCLSQLPEDLEQTLNSSPSEMNHQRPSLKTTPISLTESLSPSPKATYGAPPAFPTKDVDSRFPQIGHPQPPADSTFVSAQAVAPSVVLHSLAAQHLNHLDPQATYQKLAAVCRKGRLVREMLYDDLPTIQLETTSDFLRQNHLKLRLYAKRLGFDAPKFYGESWIPFFKIYDADVVEQMHQNFSDAYFHEKLWYEGRCIGHVEGVMVFQNNPMVRQMLAGVNTDEGFMRISPPILGAEHKSVKFVFRNQENAPDEIRKLSQLHQALLDILFNRAQHHATEAGASISAHAPSSSPKSRLGQLLHRKNKPAQSPSQCSPPVEFQGSHQELHSVCDQVLQTLRLSHVETRKSFLYQREVNLLIGQRVLLNLASHILEFSDYVPWQYRSTYGAILHQTLRRGELDLGTCLPEPPEEISHLSVEDRGVLHFAMKEHFRMAGRLGSSKSSVGSGTARSNDKRVKPVISGGRVKREIESLVASLSSDAEEKVMNYHRRMKVCRQYWLLLHRVMYYCITKLCSDCVFEGQRKYISIFLCITYFRLPHFRHELLQCLLAPEERDLEILEWRGTEFELDGKSLDKLEEWQPGCGQRLTMDWTPMSDALDSYFGREALEDALKSLPPPPPAWKEMLKSRGASFFSFVEHWAKHVYQAISQKQNFQWQLLPGYPTLLKAMLIEMKSRDITKYPDSLLNCSGAMLANEKLLSVFIKILFLKTSAYNSSAVFAALNYVDYWIQVLSLRDQQLPENFDLRFLRRGLDIVLGSDIGLCIAKGLWFIYKNLPTFKEAQLKVFLIDLLFEKYFYTLFLNWSWLVRRCFMWFLLYRVCETTRRVLAREMAVTAPGVPIPPTTEEKVMIWGYLELSNYLARMNGPVILPKHLTATKLPELLLLDNDDDIKMDGGRHRSQSDWVGGTTSPSRRNPNDLQDLTAPLKTRLSPSVEEMHTRVRQLSENGDALLKGGREIPERSLVYVNSAIPEFIAELEVYRNWIASGADPLPTMNIPASPLDNNVDVPMLENW